MPRSGELVDLASIAGFCRQAGLAMHKLPEQVEVVEELPKNASGKVLKHELQAHFGVEAGA